MTSQQSLSIDFGISYTEADFYTSPANHHALQMLGEHKFLLLTGDEACGKTHMAHIFCEKFGAKLLGEAELRKSFATIDSSQVRFAVDDVDKLSVEAQESLFHIYNLVNVENNGLFLLTSKLSPKAIINNDKGGLGDWHSRLLSFQTAEVIGEVPDDEHLLGFLRKNFQDRQIYPKSNELTYILRKCPRDFASLQELVKAIHKRMLEKQAKLSKTLIAELVQT